ncbi:hypothetical protein GCM10009737_03110 [Nocardioides lentus]|uniref:Uncharacterized protein n=1 Tax=Nocardioides lentus TaxID=338077 RepID=A0ABP5A782_9ACTN
MTIGPLATTNDDSLPLSRRGPVTGGHGIRTPHCDIPEPDETARGGVHGRGVRGEGAHGEGLERAVTVPELGAPPGDLCSQVLVFAHLAQIALGLAALAPDRRDDVVRDLDALRHECEDGAPRRLVVSALVGDVVDLLLPDLDPAVTRSLLDALPAPPGG